MMVLASAALLVRAAAAVTIPELLADPQAFDQSIVLTGNVEAAIPVGGESGYNLSSGPAVITVVSRDTTPAVGTHLAVTGTVRAFKEDDEGTLPPLFFESSRSILP